MTESTTSPVDVNVPLSDDQHLLIFLQTHHLPCPACKYDLHQLTEARCPECGRKLALTVGVVEPYLRTWVAVIAILCANAGLGVAFLLSLIVSLRYQNAVMAPQLIQKVIMTYYIATIPATVFFFWKRGWFIRLDRSSQRNILIGVIILTVLAFVGLSLGM
jgi:predicted amidophosphoribosyltransferase